MSGRPEPVAVGAAEEVAPVEDRVRAAQRDQAPGELEQPPLRSSSSSQSNQLISLSWQ